MPIPMYHAVKATSCYMLQLQERLFCVHQGDAHAENMVTVKVHKSYLSSLKIYHPTLTFDPPVTRPVRLSAILAPRGAYSPAAISAH